MSSMKPAFKPGQSGKKAAPRSAPSTGRSASASGGLSSHARTLAQQIAQLSNPTPKDVDPEDEDTGGLASAMVSQGYDEDDVEEGAPTLISHIRKNFDIEDVSEEYKGKVVSRKSLSFDQHSGDEQEEDEEDEEEDGEDDEDEEEGSDDQQMMDEDDEDGEGEDEEGEDEEEEDGEDDEEDEEGSDAEGGTKGMLASGLSAQQRRVQEQLAALEAEDEQAGASLFHPRGSPSAASSSVAPVSATSQYTKSVHMQNQLAWYTQLLNLRIRVQGVMACANRLPPAVPAALAEDASVPESVDVRSHFEAASPSVAPAYATALRGAGKLLEELFELQRGLLEQNRRIFGANASAEDDEGEEGAAGRLPKWEGIGHKRSREAQDDEDTEAAPEEDEEDADSVDPEAALSAYWSYLSGQVRPFLQPVQNALIDKWNTRTQLSAGLVNGVAPGGGSAFGKSGLAGASGLKVINQSVLSQIEQLMTDEGRLIKRSQMHRAAAGADGAHLLGRVSEERKRALKRHRTGDDDEVDGADADPSTLLSGRYAEVYDASIYDDNDYYQQLLAEIISAAASGSAAGAGTDGGVLGGHDAAQLARAAAAARKKGRKGATLVDRRASKGRKMRYTVHPKLANFMAPRAAAISDDYAARAAAGQAQGSAASQLTGSGFALDELFMNLFGGQGKQGLPQATQAAAHATTTA